MSRIEWIECAQTGGEDSGSPATAPDDPGTWPLAETWEDCARHVERGGVVQVLDGDGVWRDSRGTAEGYRQWAGAPGTSGWKAQRLAPTAPAPESSPDGEGEERERLAPQLALWIAGQPFGRRPDETESAYAVRQAEFILAFRPIAGAIALATRLAAWPEVPDGCEVLVVPEWVSDELAEWGEEGSDAETRTGNAARAAVDRRPKPEPRVEPFKGRVIDAGGGEVRIVIDRDTMQYPPVGSRVEVLAEDGES